VASSTGGGICDPVGELSEQDYDSPAAMIAAVPSLAQIGDLAPGVQTILIVYRAVPAGAIEGITEDGSFAPVSTVGPGDRVICIDQPGRRFNYYTHVDVPEAVP
jgi:hypothetical protein